jgi:hypothetical protein
VPGPRGRVRVCGRSRQVELQIALVTTGKYDASYKKIVDAGWTLVRYRLGNSAPEMFDSLDELLAALVAESQ